MNYFNKNIELIKDCHPYLYKELNEYFGQEIKGIESIEEDKLDTNLALEYAKAGTGEAVLFIEKEEKIYRFNSCFDPSFEAKKWAEQFEDKEYYSVVQVFGLGTGVFVAELMRRLKKDTPFMIYEPSIRILIHTLYFCDLTELLERENVYITFGSDDLEKYQLTLRGILGWDTISYQKTIYTPCYEEVFLVEQRKWLEAVKKANTNIRMNINTIHKFSRLATLNSIQNMKHIGNNYDFLALKEAISTDMPVILVAAGPSLDKNIEFLKRAKGKALIIAVDRALNPLFEHDIIPDMSSTIDPIKPLVNYQHPLSEEVPLLYIQDANPKILDAHKGKKFLLANKGDFTSEILSKVGFTTEQVNTGGSVATATFSALVAVGFKTIILIGQDLCIYGSHTHAFAAEKNNESCVPNVEDLIAVKANEGGTVNTRHDFLYYIEWYNEYIKGLKDTHTIINATEGGALIKGTKVMRLEEAIDEYCKKNFDVTGILNHMPKAVKTKEAFVEVIEEMLEELKTMKEGTKEAIDLCYDLIENSIQKGSHNSKAKKLENKLKEVNEKILEMDMYSMVDGLISSDLQNTMNDINVFSNDQYDDTRKTYDYSKTLYESMLVAIDDLKSEVETLRTNVIAQ